jgi:RNA polymerase sigma factor (sigma-70 family)
MATEQDFIQAITEHQRIIHKVCNLYLKETGEKEDLFQEILLNAWKGYKNFQGTAKFSTWLYRVALNTAITFYRKDNRRIMTTSWEDHYQNELRNPTDNSEHIEVMYQAIAELSKVDKAIVMLYLDDFNYQEIGDIIGITPNNVAVKMTRIKAKLQESSKKHLSTY